MSLLFERNKPTIFSGDTIDASSTKDKKPDSINGLIVLNGI